MTDERPAAGIDATRRAPGPAARLAVVVVFAGIAFLLLQIATYGHGRDQGIYTMVAKSLLEGGMPYRDAWDFKPPAVFAIYAAARTVFGADPFGIRAFEVIGLAASAGGLVALGKRHFRDPLAGVLAAGIATLIHAQLDFWHTAQPESFGGMLTVAALAVGFPAADAPDAERRGRPRALLVAGVLFGCAGLLKPPLAGGGALLAAFIAHRRFRDARPLAEVAAPLGLVAAGGAVPYALTAAFFGARGALGDLYEVLFVFTPYYTKLGWVGETTSGMLYFAFTEWFVSYSSVATIGILLLLGFGVRAVEREFALLVAATIALHLVGVAMQAKFFPYHYGATWPLTGLLAGLGFAKLFRRLEPYGAPGAGAFAIVATASLYGRTACKDVPGSYLQRCGERLLLLTGRAGPDAADRLASVADVNAVANRRVAGWLAANVAPRDPVFIWGFEPIIYDQADRRPASRFLYNVPQRTDWSGPAMRRVLWGDLTRTPPAAVVVEHRDVFPSVTGDVLDSADSLPEFPELRDLLDREFRHAIRIEDFDIYVREGAMAGDLGDGTTPPP